MHIMCSFLFCLLITLTSRTRGNISAGLPTLPSLGNGNNRCMGTFGCTNGIIWSGSPSLLPKHLNELTRSMALAQLPDKAKAHPILLKGQVIGMVDLTLRRLTQTFGSMHILQQA